MRDHLVTARQGADCVAGHFERRGLGPCSFPLNRGKSTSRSLKRRRPSVSRQAVVVFKPPTAKYNEPIGHVRQMNCPTAAGNRPNAGCDGGRTELEPDALGRTRAYGGLRSSSMVGMNSATMSDECASPAAGTCRRPWRTSRRERRGPDRGWRKWRGMCGASRSSVRGPPQRD